MRPWRCLNLIPPAFYMEAAPTVFKVWAAFLFLKRDLGEAPAMWRYKVGRRGTPPLLFQRHLVLACSEFISGPHFEGIVLLLMADGEIKADGVVVSLHQVADDLVHRTAEGPGRILILAEAADDQPGQPVQFAAAVELPEHTVGIVKIFTRVFEEKDLSLRLYIGGGAHQVGQQGKIAADQFPYGRSFPVKGMGIALDLTLFSF